MAEHVVVWVNCQLDDFDGSADSSIGIVPVNSELKTWADQGWSIVSATQGTSPTTNGGLFVTLTRG